MTSSSETLGTFNLANEKLKEIFGDDNVSWSIPLNDGEDKQKHIIKQACQIDVENNEILQDILKQHNIKFQNCKFGFLTINDFKNIEFNNCKIEMFNSNISNTNIKEKLVFTKCEFYSKSYNIKFASTNFKNIIFEECAFNSNINIKNVKFKNFTFKECDVFGDFMANDCTFKNAIFKNNKFYGFTNFKNTIFRDNAYFNNSEFKKFADFHECKFKKLVSFYGIRFHKTPNFSSVTFLEKPILINMKFDSHSFSSIKQDCDDEIKRRLENNKEAIETEIYQKVYSDFRNSFSILKHMLNQNENLIDASNHHKAELYCKEMELEYALADSKNQTRQQDEQSKFLKKSKKEEINIIRFLKFLFSILISILKNTFVFLFKVIVIVCIKHIFVSPILFISYLSRSCSFILINILIYLFSTEKCSLKRKIYIWWHKNNTKNIIDFTKWFEYMSLLIYRKTSDHHTNLNKIFHFTLLMITSYSTYLFCINGINYWVIYNKVDLVYDVLNILLITIPIIILAKNDKKISQLNINIAIFLCLVFAIADFATQKISYVTFGVLLYILFLVFLYCTFIKVGKMVTKFIRFFSYLGFILTLLICPEIINPTLNIFNKENIENKNLIEKLSKIDYSDLANLTRLSFGDYNIDTNITFLESNIVNQRELIITNKATLENVLGILFQKNEKEELNKILKNLPNKDDLNTTLREPKNRSIALDLIFAADKVYKRGLYDMEISDKFRLRFGLADEKEIQKEIDLIIGNLARIEEVLQKLTPIVEKQKIYLDIYNAIRLDKINSQTYKSTYILYVIVMILCLYSLAKTSRKNSIVS